MKLRRVGFTLMMPMLLLAGCSQETKDRAEETAHDAKATAESAAADARENASTASADTGDQIKQAAEDVGAFAKDAAKSAGDIAKDSAEQATGAADAALQHIDVKVALLKDSSVDASHIDVDTNHESKTVWLKGRVPTAAQRTRAGDIAAEHAKGYTIRNQLTIGG